MLQITQNIRQMRVSLGMNQKEFAELMPNCTADKVSNYESERTPVNEDAIEALAEIAGVTSQEFTKGKVKFDRKAMKERLKEKAPVKVLNGESLEISLQSLTDTQRINAKNIEMLLQLMASSRGLNASHSFADPLSAKDGSEGFGDSSGNKKKSGRS